MTDINPPHQKTNEDSTPWNSSATNFHNPADVGEDLGFELKLLRSESYTPTQEIRYLFSNKSDDELEEFREDISPEQTGTQSPVAILPASLDKPAFSDDLSLEEYAKILAKPPKRKGTVSEGGIPMSLSESSSGCYLSPRKCDDGELDFAKLIDSLPEIKGEYKPVPAKLIKRIRKLCDDFNVKWADWIQKSTDWRTILILGRGVENEELKQQLVDEEYQFEFIESGPSHVTYLSSSYPKVCERSMTEPEDSTTRQSTCQLIIEGQKDKSRDFYAVTTAHTILPLEEWKNSLPADMERRREMVLRRCNAMKYKLQRPLEPPLSLNPHRRVMFAFRNSSYTLQFSGKSFGNDIAIIRLEEESVNVLKDLSSNTQKDFPFLKIPDVSPNHIETMREKSKPVYIHEHECRITCSVRSEEDHIKFTLARSGALLCRGHSGSVLYVKDQDRKWPVGMLVSVSDKDPKTYLWIMLKLAVEELHQFYGERFDNLEVINIAEKFQQP